MRKTYLLLAGAGAVLAACSGGKKTAMNDDLKKDLELASSNDGITLANNSGNAMQVVSAIERTTPPVRQQTPTTRVRRHRAAPKAPPQVVETEAVATVTDPDVQSVAPAPADDQTVVSSRPHPVAVSSSGGASSGGGGDDEDRCDPRTDERSDGSVIGSILGAVIRGGIVGGVENSVRRGGNLPNQRIPPRRGTSSSRGRTSGPTIGGISVHLPR